jgi:hypothetical protein
MSLSDRELDQILAGAGRLQTMPTPQATVEAVMFAVRERGLAALIEGDTIERLSRCDTAAHAQINSRIAKLQDTDRLLREAADA